MNTLKSAKRKSRKRRTSNPPSKANGKSNGLVLREEAPVYRVATQEVFFDEQKNNHKPLGYSPAYAEKPFTDFHAVTPETDLSALNLNWREQDLPEAERTKHVHRLHPYLGKYIPQLVEIFLRKFEPKAVCDPFSGSGTTLVEAKSLGIDAVGSDVSAFNCMLGKVKTDKYNLRKLELEIRDIVERTNKALDSSLFNSKAFVAETDNAYLKRWFHADALNELLCFRQFISEYEYQDVLKVILACAARSSRLTTHFDLDFPKLNGTLSFAA